MEEVIYTMRRIDKEKFFKKLEGILSKLEILGVNKKDVKMSISLIIRKSLITELNHEHVVKETGQKVTVDENNITIFGVYVPSHNYPYNDKILVFSNEASYKPEQVYEIIIDEILLD